MNKLEKVKVKKVRRKEVKSGMIIYIYNEHIGLVVRMSILDTKG